MFRLTNVRSAAGAFGLLLFAGVGIARNGLAVHARAEDTAIRTFRVGR
jgi:hypothetical protein